MKRGNIFNVDPERDRRLLLHKKEIRHLEAQIKQQGVTLVPLRLYLKKRQSEARIRHRPRQKILRQARNQSQANRTTPDRPRVCGQE